MSSLNRYHLNGLRAVEAVGRLGSLRRAAEELGVTVGAVSQQVIRVEDQFGRPLFERQPKGLKPTPLGQEVLQRLTAGFAQLSAGVALAERKQDGVLNVSVAPVFASKWLVWHLPGFHARHPGVRVRIDAETALVDPNTSDVDICLRVGRGDWPNVRVRKLFDQHVFPVCSPALAERLRDPHDLAHVPVIRDAYYTFGWDAWLKPNGLDMSILGTGPELSHASMCLDAAIAGQGVFLAWDVLASDALALGQLTAPFPGRYPNGLGYWLVAAEGRRPTPAVAAFEAWLRCELGSTRTRLA